MARGPRSNTQREPRDKLKDVIEVAHQRYWPLSRVAADLNVNRQRIRDLIAEGQIAAIKPGKEYLIPEESYLAYLNRKREEVELTAELRRKQRLDPWPAWDRVVCVGCGEKSVICSADERRKGWVYCYDCDRREGQLESSEYETYFSFTNDRHAWRRAAEIQKNQQIADEYDFYGEEGDGWAVVSCPECDKPLVVRPSEAHDLLRGRSSPECDHDWPLARKRT